MSSTEFIIKQFEFSDSANDFLGDRAKLQEAPPVPLRWTPRLHKRPTQKLSTTAIVPTTSTEEERTFLLFLPRATAETNYYYDSGSASFPLRCGDSKPNVVLIVYYRSTTQYIMRCGSVTSSRPADANNTSTTVDNFMYLPSSCKMQKLLHINRMEMEYKRSSASFWQVHITV